jgi:hypothetical protein
MPTFSFTFDEPSEPKPALWVNPKKLTFEDYLELTALVFDWGDSYDAKVSSHRLFGICISSNSVTGLDPTSRHPRPTPPCRLH